MNAVEHTHTTHSTYTHFYRVVCGASFYIKHNFSAYEVVIHPVSSQTDGRTQQKKEKTLTEHNIEERTAAQHTEREWEWENTKCSVVIFIKNARNTHTHILMANWEFRIDTHRTKQLSWNECERQSESKSVHEKYAEDSKITHQKLQCANAMNTILECDVVLFRVCSKNTTNFDSQPARQAISFIGWAHWQNV